MIMEDTKTLFCSSKFPGALASISSQLIDNLARALRKVRQPWRSRSSYKATKWTVPCSNPTPSRQDLWLSQPPVQWVPDILSRGQSGRGVKLTTYLHKIPTLRLNGAIFVLTYALVEDMADPAATVAENTFLNAL